MKKISQLLFTGLLVAVSLGVNAQDKTGYFGLKIGPMMIDDIGFGNFSDPTNIGLVYAHISDDGYGFEAEFTTSMSDGEFSFFGSTAEVSIQTIGFYGAFRSTGDTYFKAKAGFINESVDFDNVPFVGNISEDDTGASFGLGLGLNTGSGKLEIEYTIIEEDVNFLSIGYLF